MRKFLLLTGSLLFIAALGLGGWWAWPILFPSLPEAWLSTLAQADAALVQNRPDLARKVLDQAPEKLSVSGWLQWEKRVQAVARQTGAWTWAARSATAAQAQFPGNPQLAAVLVWTLLKDGRAAEASVLAEKVLVGGPWDSLAVQARIEAQGLAAGDWSDLAETLSRPSADASDLYERLVSLAPSPEVRKNALLAALAGGRLDQARAHLGVLTPAQRDLPPFDRLQALMAYDQGDWNRAAALLKSLSQGREENLLVLADVYLHLGDPTQARIIYDQLLADHPDEIAPSVGVNRATLALDEGQAAQALDLLGRVLAQNPGQGTDKVRLLVLESRFRLGETDAVRIALDRVMAGEETGFSLEAELLKGRLYPSWASQPRLWSLLHRHPGFSPLAERLSWMLLQDLDYQGAHRVLDFHEAALAKTGQGTPWWVTYQRALLLGLENRLSESSAAFAAVGAPWRDAAFWADWALVASVQARQVNPEARKPFLDDAMERLNKALELLPARSESEALVRRSLWLTRRGEVRTSLIPLELPALRGTLRSAAAEDFRQAVQLDSENLRASFLLRQSLTTNQEKP